jgi:transposase
MSGKKSNTRNAVGARRRRRWSEEQKKAIVTEIDVGGAMPSEVARRHGVHANLLFRWRRELGSAELLHARTATATSGPRFLPVTLTPQSAPALTTQPSMMEIVLDAGRTVRVGPDVDTGALVRIIEALEAHR